MKPYRRRLVGLPLQRSLFSGISQAALAIGARGVLPGDRFSAWLNEDGDLYLEKADAERLAAALPDLATPEYLSAMEHGLAAACAAVITATARAGERASATGETEARALISDLGSAVAALLPYGILSKFVPDALFAMLKVSGDNDGPPFPAMSPGAELTRQAAVLFGECRKRGYSAGRLKSDWPEVPHWAAELLRDFCRAQAGFGPLPWEAPGYEDPSYVLAILSETFGDGDPDAVLARLGASNTAASEGSALRRALAAWLAFLERETWYVRRAFYLGMLPLLRRLVPSYEKADSRFAAEDVLFLELNELTARTDTAAASARKTKYLADAEYFTKYGITAARLRSVMETA